MEPGHAGAAQLPLDEMNDKYLDLYKPFLYRNHPRESKIISRNSQSRDHEKKATGHRNKVEESQNTGRNIPQTIEQERRKHP